MGRGRQVEKDGVGNRNRAVLCQDQTRHKANGTIFTYKNTKRGNSGSIRSRKFC